jgi:hypothetical protein
MLGRLTLIAGTGSVQHRRFVVGVLPICVLCEHGGKSDEDGPGPKLDGNEQQGYPGNLGDRLGWSVDSTEPVSNRLVMALHKSKYAAAATLLSPGSESAGQPPARPTVATPFVACHRRPGASRRTAPISPRWLTACATSAPPLRLEVREQLEPAGVIGAVVRPAQRHHAVGVIAAAE